MGDRSTLITDKEGITEIFESCLESRVLFDITDERGTLVRLMLDAVALQNQQGLAVFFRRKQLVLSMSVLTGPPYSPLLKVGQRYTISFQLEGETYSCPCALLDQGGESLNLRFLAPFTVRRHKKRKFLRSSSGALARIHAEVQGLSFEVSNLSLEGLAICMTGPAPFHIGDEVTVRVVAEDRVCCARACVRHITPVSKGKYVCGMLLDDMDEEARLQMQDLIRIVLSHARTAGRQP